MRNRGKPYDAVAPAFPENHYKELLEELGALLSGTGKVSDRLERYKQLFVIPKEKLDAVFKAAIAEGRRLDAAAYPPSINRKALRSSMSTTNRGAAITGIKGIASA